MAKTKSKRKGRINEGKAADWREIFKAQKESKQPVVTFCEEKGLSVQSFYYWKKRLKGQRRAQAAEETTGGALEPKKRGRKPGRKPLAKSGASSMAGSAGIGGSVSVEFPNGVTIRLSDAADAQVIRDVVSAAVAIGSNGHS